MKRHLATLAVCAALIGGGMAALPASASDGGYLALGDSVPFGFNPLVPATQRGNPTNFVGYPEVYAGAHGLALANLSCPGETSSSMIVLPTPANPDNGCQRFRTRNKHLHTDYSGPQLPAAVAYLSSHPDTRLVSISIGHNDLVLMENACQMQVACELTALSEVQARLAENLATMYQAIRGTGYEGPIVAVTYYATDYENGVETELIASIDQTLTSVTRDFGGRVGSGFRAFRKETRNTDGNACAAGLLIALPTLPPSCDFHPDTRGREVLAGTIDTAIHGVDD